MTYPARSACSVLFEQGQTVEVRLIGKRGTASGFYDNFDRLSADAVSFDNRGEYAGTYVTLNPVNPDLLARRANRIETRLGRDEKSAGDNDILCRRWLPVDIDPVRPSGVSSSDVEHTAAIEKASRIVAYLSDIGWPEPVVADSGNGAHLLYRIDLPNDEQSRDLVRSVLETLDILFSDESSTVDTSVYNAARIWKLYGTTSRKGDNIKARPHRKATILSVPETLAIVSSQTLLSFAEIFPKETDKTDQTYQTGALNSQKNRVSAENAVPDLKSWLDRNSIGYRQKPYAHGSLFVLDACPFSHDHTDGAYAIQFSNGGIFAGCHHSSCGGGRQRWPELRAMFQGQTPSRKVQGCDRIYPQKGSTGSVHVHSSESSKPDSFDVQSDSGEISNTARAILQDGNPLSFMLETFACDHMGDSVVAECLALSLASRKVINARGLHVSVTGESGKGKSHAFETMMTQVPEELRLEGPMSEKALFYIKGMQPGSVIALDDIALSDQMQEILKGVTTSFRRPFTYRTVNKDRVGETCVIPERCVWWVAKVDGTGDNQVWNRMLTCWIDDSREQDESVLKRTLHEAASLTLNVSVTRTETLVCQEIWRQLENAMVVIPFAERIRFSSALNRRNPDMLLDLVRSHAILMQYQRTHCDLDGVVRILATEDDFAAAQRLYITLNSTSGSLESKLTRKEAALIEAIRSLGTGEVTISDLQHVTDSSYSVIYKMLQGSSSKGHHYEGLLAKCPAVSVCDRTLVVDESGTTSAHRRTKAYSWDERVYEAWKYEGGCWLERDDLPSDDDSPATPGPGNPGNHDDHDEKKQEIDQNVTGTSERFGQISEVSVSDPNTNCGSDQELMDNNLILCTHYGNCENTESTIFDHESHCVSSSEISSSENGDHDTLSKEDSQSDCKNNPDLYGNDARKSFVKPQFDSGLMERSVNPGDESSRQWKVRSVDFCEIDRGFGEGPCECCGSAWVHYQERMTKERLSAPPRMNRKICRSCFEKAKRDEAASFRALPGLIDPVSLVKVTSDLGRCQICDTFKATWHDPETKTVVCDSCRSRILREGS